MNTFAHRFVNNALRFSKRNALFLEDQFYTYEQLHRDSDKLARLLKPHQSPYVLLFCSKSYLFFVSTLACLKIGKGYTCINNSQSKDQIHSIQKTTDATLVIVDSASELFFNDTDLSHVESLICFDQPTVEAVWESDRNEDPLLIEVTPEDCAYVFCTSGSTGVPKIVPISHSNLLAYLKSADARYDVDETDRFLQNSALTFDVSIHEILFAWDKGACVYGVTSQAFNLVEFARVHAITFWSSVPSISRKIIQMKQLTPECLPSLRHKMWVGEPLPASILAAWKVAAPNASFENMYGPTEATVGITGFNCDAITVDTGTISIGLPYKDQKIKVCDKEWNDCESGELLLAGSQVFRGYLNNPTANEKAFVTLDGERWYRTGDLVKWNDRGELEFLSRIDDQLKVNGYRFERSDVEDRLRRCAETQMVAVLPLKSTDGLVEGTIAFINQSQFSPLQIRSRLKDFMPSYMWPKRIETKVEIILNQSHKTNYKALKAIAERI